MIFIGERINGLQLGVRKLILGKNKEEIQKLARRQAEAEANYLDLNVGTTWLRPGEMMVLLA